MIRFLPLTVIKAIQADQVHKYGGGPLVRDPAGLDSALAMPQARFAGQFLHAAIFEMAAAYGFHLCQNHPFLDGNKRTAGMVMFTFLKLNGLEPTASEDDYYETIMALARGELTKAQLTEWLQTAVVPEL